jgi:hypothetical protein
MAKSKTIPQKVGKGKHVDEKELTGIPIIDDETDSSSSSLSDSSLNVEFSRLRGEEKISSSEIFKIITENRQFEIENFWKRTVYFWGTLAVIMLGYYNLKDNPKVLIFLTYLGVLYNLIFSLSLRGSKYWQEHWEIIAVKYEAKMKFKLFGWDAERMIRENAKNAFWLTRPRRISVSQIAMVLSDLTLVFWGAMVVNEWSKLCRNKVLHFDLEWGNSFDPYSFGVIFFPILIFFYLGAVITRFKTRASLEKLRRYLLKHFPAN